MTLKYKIYIYVDNTTPEYKNKHVLIPDYWDINTDMKPILVLSNFNECNLVTIFRDTFL